MRYRASCQEISINIGEGAAWACFTSKTTIRRDFIAFLQKQETRLVILNLCLLFIDYSHKWYYHNEVAAGSVVVVHQSNLPPTGKR